MLGKTWFTLEEAASKYGLPKDRILEWVEEGVVRCERDDGQVARVNIDDIQLQSDILVRES